MTRAWARHDIVADDVVIPRGTEGEVTDGNGAFALLVEFGDRYGEWWCTPEDVDVEPSRECGWWPELPR